MELVEGRKVAQKLDAGPPAAGLEGGDSALGDPELGGKGGLVEASRDPEFSESHAASVVDKNEPVKGERRVFQERRAWPGRKVVEVESGAFEEKHRHTILRNSFGLWHWFEQQRPLRSEWVRGGKAISVGVLGYLFNASERTVKTWLGELRGAGWIETVRTRDGIKIRVLKARDRRGGKARRLDGKGER